MRTDLLARLGEVSNRRHVQPLWSLVDRVNNKNHGMAESNLLSLSYGRIIRKEIDEAGGLRPESYETYNIIEAGDTVLRMTDLQNDQRSIRTGLASEGGIITSAYVTVRPRAAAVEPRFLAAALRAYDVKKVYYEMGAGVRQTLKFEELAHLPIPLPPHGEQGRIADYLGGETAEIDAMDAELDRLVETLRERRLNAVLSQVRLDNVARPGRVGPLQMVAEFVTGAGFPNDEQGKEDQELPVYKVNALGRADPDGVIRFQDHTISPATADRLRADVVPAGSSVLAKIGAALMLGRIRTLGQRGCIDNNMLALVPRPDVEPRYLFWALHALDMNLIVNPSTIPFLNERALRQLQIPVPTLPEQRRIAAELDELTARIDDMVADATRLKALLAERRSTLITEVVTGAKEVPA